jgi:outer membrane receptor protein involved in Fe transport
MYGSFSEGFRSGVLQDFGVPIGSAKADTLDNYELGAKGALWGGLVAFDTAVYYMDWKNVQQSLDVPYQSVYTGAVVNGQSASGPGVDLSLTTQPVTGLTLGIAGSWNRLEMDKTVYSSGVVFFPQGGRLNNSPETTVSGTGAYAFPLGSTGLTGRLAASAAYTSAQLYRVNPGGPTVFQGTGQPMVIGRVGVSVESAKHWMLTLYADNVNNERNAVVRPFENSDLTTRIRPLTTGLQLDYHLK